MDEGIGMVSLLIQNSPAGGVVPGRKGNEMARWWIAFETQEDRAAWEKAEKADDPNFRVCMHMTARQLENKMHMAKGTLAPNKYVTVYRYDLKKKEG